MLLSNLILLLFGARKGISPSRSQGTVLESLPSHGSSCLITNVISFTLWIYQFPVRLLAVILFHNNQSSHYCLLFNMKLKKGKSFATLPFSNIIATTLRLIIKFAFLTLLISHLYSPHCFQLLPEVYKFLLEEIYLILRFL